MNTHDLSGFFTHKIPIHKIYKNEYTRPVRVFYIKSEYTKNIKIKSFLITAIGR